MKRYNITQWLSLLLGGLILSGAQLSVHAGNFTWSAPAAITTANAMLNQAGTIVGGEVFGTREVMMALTNNTAIDFKTDGSVASATGNGMFYGANTNETGNANFDTVLTQANYDGGPKTITLNNLTVGVQYSIQLFALDDRGGGESARQANFQDPGDGSDVSATFHMGDNVYVLGTFTATNSTMSIQENLITDTGGNINALVIRQLNNLPVAPQIVDQPQPATIYSGQTAQLSVVAYGTALTYQWQKSSVGGSTFTNVTNGSRISGTTSLTLTITNLAAGDTGDYQVVISNATGPVTTTPATLTVQGGTPLFNWAAPMTISSADATLGQTGTVVGAEVFGTVEEIVTLTNGTVIDFKADGSAAAVTGGGNGTASGAFSGTTGNANFNSALTQFNYDGGPKIITLFNLVGGQQYTVQLFALDDRGGLSSGVRANFQDPNDSVDISSTIAMGDNVSLVGTFTAPGSGSVNVNIEENLPDNGGGGNINALVVRALGVLVAPQITLQPQSVTIDQSLNTSFTVAASGTTPFSYRWQRGPTGSGIFTNVPANSRYAGQTSSTLTITNLATVDSADYQAIVVNAAGSATSAPPATLSVQAVTPQFVWATPGAITTADVTLNQNGSIVGAQVFGPTPEIVVLANGTSVDFKNDGVVATATGGGTFVGAFLGNTSNTTFNAVLNQASYENGYNPIVPTKTITLNNLVVGQQYAVQLFGLDDRNGTATRNVNFQDPNDGNDYSGTFFMPNNVFTIGTFTAVASSVNIQENLFGTGGNINALVVRQLSSQPVAPQITTQPASTTLNAGANFQFTVGANGTSLAYQWQSSPVGSGLFSNVGVANASGAHTAQLTLTGVTTGNTADYRVIVSNGAGSVTSAPSATLTVVYTPPNLTHRWSFNETSGTTAHDSVGGANGTLQGSAAFTGSGYVNLPNPGSSPQTGNSYVSIPGGLLNGFSSVTIQCWVTNNGWNNGNTFMGFSGPIDGNGFGTNYINFYSRMFSSISAFEIATTAGDSGLANLGPRFSDNSVASGLPDLYTYTYDPIAGNVTLYTNGVFSGSQAATVPLSSLGTNVGTIGLSVYNQSQAYTLTQNGGSKPNCPYLNGGIGEVRIYSGVLASKTIIDAYNLGPDQLPAAPAITTQPQSVFVLPGATARFTVVATGAPLNYQWQRAALGSTTFSNVTDANASGMTTSQLTVHSAAAGNVANYRVVISNGSGSVTSSPAATLVLNVPAALAHRWSFNETSGMTAHDSVGGADGTLEGSATFTGSGYVNLPNPGSNPQTGNSYVSIPGGLLNGLSAVTIECWVTNNGWNNGNTFMGFSGPIDGNGFGTNYINFYSRMFSSISAFEIATTAGDSGLANLGPRFNNNSIASGVPDHYVYVYDPTISQTISLWTNSVFSGSQPANIPLSSLGTSVGTIGLSVYNQSQAYTLPQNGGNKANCPYLNGGISEVRIYSGALSSNAIAATQLLGPDQLLSTNATLNVSVAGGTLNIVWPIANGAFKLVTSPVLGTGAVWTPVSLMPSVSGSNYQAAIPSTNATAFFRLQQ